MDEYNVKMHTDSGGLSIVYKTNTYEAAKVFLDGAYDVFGRKGFGVIEKSSLNVVLDNTRNKTKGDKYGKN